MSTSEEIELKKAQNLKSLCNDYVSALKKAIKQKEKFWNKNLTAAQRGRLRDDSHSNGEHVERLRHNIHCLCVELELAAWEDWRYTDSKTSAPIGSMGSFQHVYRPTPRSKSRNI